MANLTPEKLMVLIHQLDLIDTNLMGEETAGHRSGLKNMLLNFLSRNLNFKAVVNCQDVLVDLIERTAEADICQEGCQHPLGFDVTDQCPICYSMAGIGESEQLRRENPVQMAGALSRAPR